MFGKRSRDQSIEATLKQLEHRVLDEVQLASWQRRVAWVAAAVLLAAGVTIWTVGTGVALATSALGIGAAICSVVALRCRRFRWCMTAAYLSGLSTVAGVGAFWWSRTGATEAMLAAAAAGVFGAAAALTVVWVSVAITPMKDSHPDMPPPSKRKWGVRDSGDTTIVWPPPSAGPRRPDQS